MSRNSYMLIHQLSTTFWGTYANFEDEKKKLRFDDDDHQKCI